MYFSMKNISKSFNDKKVIKEFNLNVEKGEIVSLLGPSGCGKTTILKIIGGFLKPSSGKLILDNEDITNTSPEKRDVATVFQSFALFPNMNVLNNIIYGLKFKGISKKEAIFKGEEIIEVMGLKDYKNAYPSTLSGGQKQRVALARSLILNPKLLLLDEALSSLDAKLRIKMREEIREIRDNFNTTMIFVTHDQQEALSISDKIAIMNNGIIEQIDSPMNIYNNAKEGFVKNFIGECNSFTLNNKNISIRPEDIKLVNINAETNLNYVVGTITKVVFMGFYVNYEVALENNKINVKHFNNENFLIGSKVKVII